MLKQHMKGESPVFTGDIKTLNNITEWARSLCHLAHGPVAGEAIFRQLPAKQILELWLPQKP